VEKKRKWKDLREEGEQQGVTTGPEKLSKIRDAHIKLKQSEKSRKNRGQSSAKCHRATLRGDKKERKGKEKK